MRRQWRQRIARIPRGLHGVRVCAMVHSVLATALVLSPLNQGMVEHLVRLLP